LDEDPSAAVDQHEQTEREQRLQRLIDVGRALVSELDQETLLQRVLEAARELTGARYAALGVLDESRSELSRFLTVGIDDETHRAIGDLPRGRGVLGALITDPRPLRLADVGDHPRSYGFPPGHPVMRSFLGVPIVVRGVPYGNLYLTEKDGAFDEDDEQAAVVLADWAAIAIDNARVYGLVDARRAELERAVTSLEATTEIARVLAGETDLARVLELIVKRARALTEARAALVLLQEGDELEIVAIAGEVGPELMGHRLPVEGTIGGHVLTSGRAERLADAPSRLRFALADAVRAETALFVPLLLRGVALGVLVAFDRLVDGPEFSASDERVLTGFATSAAAAVGTAQTAAGEALRRSIDAQERERGRWARELHDDTLQELAGLKLLLGQARRAGARDELERALDEAGGRIDEAITTLRALIADLRPATLDEHGLGVALAGLAARVTEVHGLTVDLRVELAEAPGNRLAPALEETVYRLVQEALTNVIKHAGATRAEVLVTEGEELLTAAVRDDGAGFDADVPPSGFGIVGMRERAALANGSLSVSSSAGGGTVVEATLPVVRAGAGRARLGLAGGQARRAVGD
jgi:signal transduction histidine kinase